MANAEFPGGYDAKELMQMTIEHYRSIIENLTFNMKLKR